jgi:transposase
MRGGAAVAGSLFSYVDLEQRVRADHPLRVIRGIVHAALADLSASSIGRVSIPPDRLLRALLLQAFYSIHSDRQLVERVEFDLLFRWFVGLGVDDPAGDAATFINNRDRLLAGAVAVQCLATVRARPKIKALLSTEQFSAHGTLLKAWASTKSFRPRRGCGPPPGGAQWRAGLPRPAPQQRHPRLNHRSRRPALPQGSGQASGRRSAIDGRTTPHPGYAVSLRIRKRSEEAFGWAKTVAGLRKARHRGLAKIDWQFTFAMAAYNRVACRSCWRQPPDARTLPEAAPLPPETGLWQP